jgi:hypothetical protein
MINTVSKKQVFSKKFLKNKALIFGETSFYYDKLWVAKASTENHK